ncbi:MAG: M23 family metallopeptidase, partial [Oscillospiraceae bacterium]|nr:M23 family metallopeptidase [Oscillospiraceae bacterium]
SGSSGSSNPPASGESFCFPLQYCTMLTSSYGYRVHPITGNYSFHNGVDLAAGQGTPIYATKSGTVSTATYNYAYGYYVVVNHLDGYSSLYGHMTHYTVSEGDYVERGEIIGYVGSTGYSTGPHLHFTIYYNGSTVNPMNYISF